MARARVLTWHVHGSYLRYLAAAPAEFYLPVRPGRPEGYAGVPPGRAWPANLHEVPAEAVPGLGLDVVLTQSRRNWEVDRHEVLSRVQARLPRVHLEHDPPREHPTDTRHFVDDPDALLVHVTAFNDLMWDPGRTPTRVVDHGVSVPEGARATYELGRGVTVVNHLARRGRRLGADVFERARRSVPLDLVGMGAEEAGGLGEVPPDELAAFCAPYRFFFHPIRYTSLGLALCEAMMLGLPVVALATTEAATVVDDGASGFASTSVDVLVARMGELLADPGLARRLGAAARLYAQERFGLGRFARDWAAVFADVTGTRPAAAAGGVAPAG